MKNYIVCDMELNHKTNMKQKPKPIGIDNLVHCKLSDEQQKPVSNTQCTAA